jgi:hypothetical protein
MISLAQRILTLPCRISDAEPDKRQFALAASDRKRIADAPVVHIDEVAELFALHEKSMWHPSEFPNWAPPFDHFFVEWNQPRTWLIDGRLVTQEPCQFGFLVGAIRGRKGIEEVLSWTHAPWIAQYDIHAAEWMLIASAWGANPAKPICGAPCYLDYMAGILVRGDGACIVCFADGKRAQPETAGGDDGFTTTMLNILGFGISFMHCRHVATERIDAPLGKSRRRNHSCATGLKHYTLRIGPAVHAIRRESGVEHSNIKRALHICRGHFMHYTEARPLFGKYAGTFYCPDHVRGQVEAGRVEKEYAVHAEAAVANRSGETYVKLNHVAE